MNAHDKAAVIQMLTQTLAAYSKPRPEAPACKTWLEVLAPFDVRAIAASFAAYRDEVSDFAPIPNAIAMRCKKFDGRPTADEAWAIALTSRDEGETVVWTEEMAEAYALCRSIMLLRDEVGARRAFIDAYNRLVQVARMSNQPAKWVVSAGWDRVRRDRAIEKAAAAGLLAAPAAVAMLSGPTVTKSEKPDPNGMRKVRDAVAKVQAAWKERQDKQAAQTEQRRQAEQQKKHEIDEQVRNYRSGEK